MALKVLLCYLQPSRVGGTAVIPKLGLGTLASSLRSAGHHVELLDVEQLGMTAAQAESRLSERWDAVGFQVFSNQLGSFRRALGVVKAAHPATLTVAGGPLASGLPKWLLERHSQLDYVLRGEAELSLPALLEARGDLVALGAIPGIGLRIDGTPHLGLAPQAPDIDRLPPPAWDLMPPARYPDAPVGGVATAFPVGPIITSRGCPHPCPYCAARVIHGRGLRTRAPDQVLSEMEELVRRWGVREIQVLDDCFGQHREVALAILEGVRRAPWRVPLSFPNGMRLDNVDAEVLAAMEAAGTTSVTFGVDFGSDRMLEKMNRGMSVADVEAKLSFLRTRSKIRLTCNFILGHFDDTREGMLETLRLAWRLPIDRAHFSAYIPIPGTPDWRLLERRVLIDAEALASADFNSFSLPHPSVSRAELGRLKRLAYLGFYAKVSRLARLLRDARSPQNLLFLLRKVRYHS